MEIINALVVFTNFVFVPGLAYGSQLALGALGITIVYAILRFSNSVSYTHLTLPTKA